ncbi:MAG TPA: SMP-30/gluconolactonase/LRE family protein [Terracidiphilus sp.]|nr:SMP-30/gluconolactonase/LRE family protein [Terracidiphilus sp.]
MKNELRCVVPAGDICGEGALWHPEQGALYWTDINRFLVHRFDPKAGTTQTWLFDEPVTSVNLTTRNEELLVVLGSRIGLWSPHTHPGFKTIHTLAEAPVMRFNDARVDPRGSLWVGTMRNNVGPHGELVDVEFADGVLYRIDPDGMVTEWRSGIGISNTVAWSTDGNTFCFGDTTANILWAFDYNTQTGAISGQRNLLANFGRGKPDGSAMDSEGFLWNARYDGGCVVRIAPNGGIDRVVEMPVSSPTTCAFGGSENKTLFITSARSAEQLSGSVFALDVDVRGVPDGRFQLT